MAEWHLITGEYPPQIGGVSDYTRLVAAGLAEAGDRVHVWCPRSEASPQEYPGVSVHRELGSMRPQDLRKVSRMLNQFGGPRRLLVQWVPHAFGFRSANVPLSFWIWNRVFRHHDHLEVMIHEPYLPLRQDHLRHTALAVIHRMMLTMVLRAATRVWIAIPKWEEYCRPFLLGRSVPFTWLPVISNISMNRRPGAGEAARVTYATSHKHVIGHFGTCGGEIGRTLRILIPELLNHHPERMFLLIGADGKPIRDELSQEYPQLRGHIHVTGLLSNEEVSSHISSCDVMVQPYPDGASSRRGSLMAAISHGKAVVTTTGRLTDPAWSAGGSAVLVPAEYPFQLARSVENLLTDECERLRLGGRAKDFYYRHFDLRNVIDALRSSPLELGGVSSEARRGGVSAEPFRVGTTSTVRATPSNLGGDVFGTELDQ